MVINRNTVHEKMGLVLVHCGTCWRTSSGQPVRRICWNQNQQKHYYRNCHSSTIRCRDHRHSSFCSATCVLIRAFPVAPVRFMRAQAESDSGRIMPGQVILYFDDQADALRFALAAGSVMAGDVPSATSDLFQETARVTRIQLDAANQGKSKQSNPPGRET
jgi:hypothetical protein